MHEEDSFHRTLNAALAASAETYHPVSCPGCHADDAVGGRAATDRPQQMRCLRCGLRFWDRLGR